MGESRYKQKVRAEKYRKMERRAGIALMAFIVLMWVWMTA